DSRKSLLRQGGQCSIQINPRAEHRGPQISDLVQPFWNGANGVLTRVQAALDLRPAQRSGNRCARTGPNGAARATCLPFPLLQENEIRPALPLRWITDHAGQVGKLAVDYVGNDLSELSALLVRVSRP